ncbi:cell division protein ZipA [Marinobacterium sp. YM272]|uniref:cell division protein ZipA n=1 Tax=Marinobacterium sp. YM272 TaxID=3421654 RepID=UPI003D7FE45D
MEISLREWLIIGGILVIALILFDGWRRIRGNGSRIHMDIDRSAVSDGDDESVSPSNPELPNGGARRIAEEEQRHEPVFSPEPAPASAESDRIPDWPASKPSAGVEQQPDLLADQEAELDPLFDDVPVGRRRSSAASQAPQQHSAKPAPSTLDTPLTARRDEDDIPSEPEPLSLDFDPEQPIPVLMDRVRPSSERKNSERKRPVEVAEEPAPETEPVPAPSDDGSRLGEALSLDLDADPDSAEAEPARSAPEPEIAELPREKSPDPEPVKPLPVAEKEAGSESGKNNRPAPEISADPDEMLVIFVVARQGQTLPGAAIHRIADACGMEIGAMDIYHRHEHPNAQGSLQFSMANAIQPGTFDQATMDELETPAVTFFMSMRDPADPMYAYECMLATAETLARHLEAEMLDGDRSVMRPQTKEHYRERIRDFEIHKRVRRAH